jgi:ATP-dependent helicase/nuclease subunit A
LPAEERTSDAPCGYDLYAKMEDEEDQAELTRLFYVATTRAADYLLLSAGVPRLGSTKGPWTQLLAKRFDLQAGQVQGALPPGYETPAVRVTLTEPPQFAPDQAKSRRTDLQQIIVQVEELANSGPIELPQMAAAVPPDLSARRQYSFSRLSGGLRIAHPALETEDDPADAAADPMGLGTLVHAVLAKMEWGRQTDVAVEVTRHAEAQPGMSDAEVAAAVKMVGKLLQSERARQLAAARQVHTELEFLLAWKLPEVYLHGFIDCLYEDQDGNWRLLDYKTNNVSAASVPAAAAAYEMQMLVYALAAEQSLRCPLASVDLHFLRPGVDFSYQLDAAARRRLEMMVNQRLQEMSIM